MSVQHRSRIRTVVDYGVELSDLGCCCYPPDHPLYAENLEAATGVSYQECVSESGYFIACESGEEATCPDLSSKGCCCACSYVEDFDEFLDQPGPNYPQGCPDDPTDTNDPRYCYQGGLKEVTYCECNDLNGRWSPLPCTEYYDPDNIDGGWQGSYVLCDPPNEDVPDIRFPDACCIPPTEEGGLDGQCVNVCSPQECIDAAGDISDVVYYEGQNCQDNLPECGYSSGGRNVKRYKNGLIIGNLLDNTTVNEKSCCIIETAGNVLCKGLIESECIKQGGIWGGLNEHSQTLQCSDKRCSDLQDYIKNEKNKISSSTADSWYIGQKVLDLGVYIGDFNVKSRVYDNCPVCFGNQKTGVASEYKPESYDGDENSEKTYAVILAPSDIGRVVYDNQGESAKTNSLWDTHRNHDLFNRDLSLTKIINQREGDFKIASLDLWSFISEQLRNTDFYSNLLLKDNNPMLNFNNIVDDYYWTSSMMQVGNESFAYIHNGSSVGLCKIKGKNHRVRPVMLLEKT